MNTPAAFTPFYLSDFCSQTITSDCTATFSYIDTINDKVFPVIQDIVKTSYFRYFLVDFDKECQFWNEGHFCATQNCAVEMLPTMQINWDVAVLKDSPLGIETTVTSQDSNSLQSDLDYCIFDTKGDYVSLLDNPERFTGYAGKQAHNVWDAIYKENCFKVDEDECSTKKLFFRVISGMHASISTHLSNEYLLDLDEGDIGPNLKIFMERVGQFNDRISNLYFNYGLVSQALLKLVQEYPLVEYLQISDELIENHDDYHRMFADITQLLGQEPIFNSDLIIDPELKDEFRAKFRNISSIMDCVGCDRCRVWGKLQTIGYGTALKVLFEDSVEFKRIEIVSLINTFDRLSKSIEAVKNFKRMYLEHLEDVDKGLVQPGDFDKDTEKNGMKFPFMAGGSELKKKIRAKTSQDAPAKKEEKKEDKKDDKKEEKKQQTAMPWTDQWKAAYDEVLTALTFVLRSYKHFPFILFRKFVIYANYYWKTFVGIETGDYIDEVLFQQDYVSYFTE